MDLSTWSLFVITELALCITPGPAVLYVSMYGLSRGMGASIAGNLGIVTGNSLYFIASAAGLSALILTSHYAFFALKWLGVLMLLWLGIQSLVTAKRYSEAPQQRQLGYGAIYFGGVTVQLANPKNLLFFLAILPPFIDASGNIILQIIILGVTSQIVEFLVLAGYGGAARALRQWLNNSAAMTWIGRMSGILLIAIGIALAFVQPAEGPKR